MPTITMSSFSRKAVAAGAPRFRSALRKLEQHGAKALQPQFTITEDLTGEGRWRKPAVSKRVANVLRKQAIKDGTYGNFRGPAMGGWDPAWDVEMAKVKSRGQGRHGRLAPPKKANRQRTRQERAEKIEKKMEGMDERIEQHFLEKHANKPTKTFQNLYKSLMKVRK